MKIVVDLGNSSINFGVYQLGAELPQATFSIKTEKSWTMSQYLANLKPLFASLGLPLTYEKGILASVVPELSDILVEALFQLTGCRILTLAPGLKTGVLIKAENQAEVGGDLIAAAAAVNYRHQLPALIIDLGTATTISYLDRKGSFCGVAIAPGLKTMARSVIDAASLLYDFKLEPAKQLIGRNSADALRAGIVNGHALMLNGFIEHYQRLEPDIKIIITGGLAGVIAPLIKAQHVLDPNLILTGLLVILELNNAGK